MATIPVHPVFLNDTVNDTENDTENDTVIFAELPKRQQDVLASIHENDRITESQMSQKFSVSRSTISRATTALKERKIIIRIGSDRSGSWMIVKKGKRIISMTKPVKQTIGHKLKLRLKSIKIDKRLIYPIVITSCPYVISNCHHGKCTICFFRFSKNFKSAYSDKAFCLLCQGRRFFQLFLFR